ncbi:ABC transporter [Babesia ovata]|uniref:ABC transporter n=1 Tax=Babesia ovata TaxID=189622 RepID=A0A2H6K9R8_9APIC|nr:ABC transporter [Babesia ovata]GBE59736.1 ABC transporter [Babesia ovata]
MGAAYSKPTSPKSEEVATPTDVSVCDTVRRFFSELEPEEKRNLVMGGCAMVVNAATNMLYPKIIGNIIDSGSTGQVFGPVSWLPGCHKRVPPLDGDEVLSINCPYAMFKMLFCSALPLYAVGSVASWVRVSSMNHAIYLIQKRSRKKMFEKMLMQGAPFFHTRASGLLIAKLLNDCEEGPKAMVENAFTFLRCCNSVIGGTINLISISPCLTAVTMTCIPLFGLFIIGYSSIIKRCQRQRKELLDDAIGQAEEVISGIESVMNFGKETDEIATFSYALDRCDSVSRRVCNSEGVLMGSILAGFNLSTLIMLYCGSYRMKSGDISVGNMASFILYGALFGLGVSGLSKASFMHEWSITIEQITSDVSKAAVSLQRIYEIHDLEDQEDDGDILDNVRGDLEFDNVSFSYGTRADTPVLRDMSLKIEAGEVVAIVGANGMGKSTTANLLTTLYKPTGGRVLLDGIDVQKLNSRWLRSKVFTVVTQDPLLFSMSIAQNLRYSNEDVSDEEMKAATRYCEIQEFIESLPSGYDETVGQRGALLSTGQKQRIGLARALLRDTPCLILDEAMSALDGSSEDLVRRIINRLMEAAKIGDGRVAIQVTVADSYHVSGGPFCCFVRVAPVESQWSDDDPPVSVDFISLNVYGIVSFSNRLFTPSKIQNNLHFGFLKEARRRLKPNEGAHLICASDAVLFHTCTEIDRTSPESYYRYTCTIPPFVPPTVDGENISCNYYVDVTVQHSSNRLSLQRQTLHRRLEFRVQGSIYPESSGVPTLDDALYPFLPKKGGYTLDGGRVDEAILPRVCQDITSGNYGRQNMLFDYESMLVRLEAESPPTDISKDQSPDAFLLSRDLNAFWHVWDTMNGSGFLHEPEESYVLRRYNGFVEQFTELVLNDTTGKELEKYRPWFGSMLQIMEPSGGRGQAGGGRHEALRNFYKVVEERIEQLQGTTMDNLRRTAGDSLEMQYEQAADGSNKVMNFSLEGRKLCTCNLQGFGQLRGAQEFTLPTNSWFTVHFDFPDAFRCLQVDVNLVRFDVAGTQEQVTSEVSVVQRSLYTLGKTQSSVTLFVPMHTTPTFISSFLAVSYKLELRFSYYAEAINTLQEDTARAGLSRLRMLKWDHSVRLLQSESVRLQSRCFRKDEPASMERTLQLARALCDRPNTTGLMRGAPALSTTFNIV